MSLRSGVEKTTIAKEEGIRLPGTIRHAMPCLSLCREGRGRPVKALRGRPRHRWSITRPTNALIVDKLTGRDRGHPSCCRGSESRLRSVPQSLDRSQGFGKDGYLCPGSAADRHSADSRQRCRAKAMKTPQLAICRGRRESKVPAPTTSSGSLQAGLCGVLANSAICRYLYGILPPRSRRPLCPLSKS